MPIKIPPAPLRLRDIGRDPNRRPDAAKPRNFVEELRAQLAAGVPLPVALRAAAAKFPNSFAEDLPPVGRI